MNNRNTRAKRSWVFCGMKIWSWHVSTPARTWAGVGLLLFVSGCEAPTTALVSGSVTVDGEPAKTGAISFFPVDNVGTPVGGSIEAGQYSVQVPFGEKKVQVRVSKVVGKQRLYDTADSPIKDVMTEALPPKYNSATELRLDVKPGENRQDYDLTTQ